MGSDAGSIKGAAIREFFVWLTKRLRRDGVEELIGRLTPEDRAMFAPDLPGLGIVSGHWYDAGPVLRLCEELTRSMSHKEVHAMAQEGARATLAVTLNGVHRLVLKAVGTPSLHRRFAQRLWNTYYDNGTVDVSLPSDHESVIAYSHWRAHHPFLCDFTSASDYVVYGAMGCADVEVEQLRCISKGDPDCAHRVRWTP